MTFVWFELGGNKCKQTLANSVKPVSKENHEQKCKNASTGCSRNLSIGRSPDKSFEWKFNRFPHEFNNDFPEILVSKLSGAPCINLIILCPIFKVKLIKRSLSIENKKVMFRLTENLTQNFFT